MKKYLFYNLLFVLTLLIGCDKKDLPGPVDGIPVFSAHLDFGNGTTKSWEAGVDSFYMFTSFEKDSLDVFSFIGKMARENCKTGCTETLEIRLRDVGKVTTGIPNPDESISRGEYKFTNANLLTNFWIFDSIHFYHLNLRVDTVVSPFTGNTFYEWFQNGNQFASDTPFTSLTADEPIFGEITLKITDSPANDSCVSWQTQTIDLDPEKRCAVRIQPNYNVDFFIESLEALPFTQNNPTSFNWSNGSTEPIINQIQNYTEYFVTITDANNCSAGAGYLFSNFVNDQIASCSAKFEYDLVDSLIAVDSTLILVPGDPLQFATVSIIYVDGNGHTFRSDNFEQTTNAFFKIENVEDYDDNEKGESTKKLSLLFRCMLWDENGNELPIVSGDAIWGAAHPK